MGPGSSGATRESKSKKKMPELEEFLQNRDFTGARTLLEVYTMFIMFSKRNNAKNFCLTNKNLYDYNAFHITLMCVMS